MKKISQYKVQKRCVFLKLHKWSFPRVVVMNKSLHIVSITTTILKNLVNCKYYDINQIKNLNTRNNNKSLSIFHLNTCSLSGALMIFNPYPIIKYYFDVTAISKWRISKNKPSVVAINLPNYSYEFCPTESLAGGTLLYVRSHLT